MPTGSARETMAFLLLCAIWGMTWIATKMGISSVPPLLFAGTRFLVAGAVLLAVHTARYGMPHIARAHFPRFAIASFLTITMCYGLLFWGMQSVESGTGAVLNLSLTPIALVTFAVLLKEETFSMRIALAIALGVTGLVILFWPQHAGLGYAASSAVGWQGYLGGCAVAAAAFFYGAGAIGARPLLRAYPSLIFSGASMLLGGAVLIGASLGFERGAYWALTHRWDTTAIGAWLFLLCFGSLIGYSIFMRLLKTIGPSRAGSYAFVSPVVAVVIGAVFYGENITVLEVAGIFVMLTGAYLAMSSNTDVHLPLEGSKEPQRP